MLLVEQVGEEEEIERRSEEDEESTRRSWQREQKREGWYLSTHAVHSRTKTPRCLTWCSGHASRVRHPSPVQPAVAVAVVPVAPRFPCAAISPSLPFRPLANFSIRVWFSYEATTRTPTSFLGFLSNGSLGLFSSQVD
jgi:hypothetical protein